MEKSLGENQSGSGPERTKDTEPQRAFEGCVLQWQNTFLACTRSWTQSQQKEEKKQKPKNKVKPQVNL